MADLSVQLNDEGLKLAQSQTSVRRPGVIYRASVYSTSAAATYTTSPTTTPAAGSLLLAFVVSCYASSPSVPTGVTGHGQTYTQVTLPSNALSTTHLISLWIANAGGSPTNAAVVASQSGTTTGGAVIEFEVTDWDSVEGLLSAISYLATATGTGTSGTISNVPIAAHAVNDDVQVSCWVHLANEATTPRTNWTETSGADGNFASPTTGVEMQFRTDVYENTASASWTTSSSWIGLVIGIDAISSLEPSEAIRISESLTAKRYGDATPSDEGAKIRDTGQGVVQILGPGSWLHISDQITAAIASSGDLTQAVPNENLKISESLTAQLTVLARNVTAENVKCDDIGQGETQLIGPGTWLHLSDQITAALASNDLSRAVTDESLKISESAAQQLDPLQQSATENVKISESRSQQLDPLITSALVENVKISESGNQQLDPLITSALTENIKISDSLTAQTDALQQNLTESLKISESLSQQLNPLITTAALTENIKISEALSQQLDPLITSVLTENIKISESGNQQLNPLITSALTDNAKISDVPTAQLDPLVTAGLSENLKIAEALTQPVITGDLSRSVTDEAIKISDSVQAERYGDRNVDTENFELDDIGQGMTQMIGVIHVVDQLTVQMGTAGPAANVTENVKISEQLFVLREPLEATPAESLKIDDASSNWVSLDEPETIKISDVVTALLGGDLAVAVGQENLKISDVVTALLGGDLAIAVGQENLKISESLQTVEDPIQISATENLKISDLVQASAGPAALVTENLKITDTVTPSMDLLVSLTELLKISDTPQAVRYPLEVVAAENVKISDQVFAGNDLFFVLQETAKIADAVTVVEDALEVNLTESVKLQDTRTSSIDLSAQAQENVHVVESMTANFPILSATATETLHIREVFSGGVDLLAVNLTEFAVLRDLWFASIGNALVIDVVGTYAPVVDTVGNYCSTIDVVGNGAT